MNSSAVTKTRLTLLSFFQFFVWGAWLTTIGTYCTEGKGWTFPQFGAIFSTLALSSILMPSLIGIIADKWMRAEKLYGILHLTYAAFILLIPNLSMLQAQIPFLQNMEAYELLYWIVFGGMLAYMPSISLSNSVSYRILKMSNLDVQTDFPKIRVWGTIGFIAAMWLTNLSGSKANDGQFYIAGIGALFLGLYAFSLPACPPQGKTNEKTSLATQLGLNAFKLFTEYRMALFFIFSILLGAALQLSNMYGDAYLSSFPKGTLVEKYSTIIYSISQISETIFILTIPFFLKRFGIKNVMFFALIAWVLRYGFFAFGSAEFGIALIVLSCVVYGMAFDFFLISGSMFVEANTDSSIRSSAQGLFIMMTNGIGAYIGTVGSSFLIGKYYILQNGQTDWHNAWLLFAAYSLVVAILFMLLFKDKRQAA
ncbi:MAG: MFS transporter [Sphingomonadales bacterium]|nr:MFS transporter [Sphingomonadales bacterium]